MKDKIASFARLLVVIVPALTVCAPAAAVDPAAAPPADASAGNPADQGITVRDLEGLVSTIENPKDRERLLKTLRGLIAARKEAAKEAPAADFGSRLVAELTDNVREAGRHIAQAMDRLNDLPLVAGWLKKQVSDDKARARWIRLLLKLALIFVCGTLAQVLVRRLLAGPRTRMEGRVTDSLWVRVPFLVGRTFLDLVPIGAFAAVAYGVAPLTNPEPKVYVVAITVINAYLIGAGVLVAARMILVPNVPSLRIFDIDGETAQYLYIWARRLTLVPVVGFFTAEAVLLLGLAPAGYAALLRAIGLMVALLVVVLILQNRRPVARILRGDADREKKADRGLGYLRRRFADIWHVLAVIYVAMVFGVWAVGIVGGFEFLAKATAASVAVVAVAGLVLVGIRRAIDRGFTLSADVKARYPMLEARANRYLPVLQATLRWIVVALAAVAVAQAWGIDMVAMVEAPFGQRVLRSAFSIAVVVIIAIVVWEFVSAGIERYLSGLDDNGLPAERTARARTLLPLLRNVVLVVVWVLVTLIVFSELGINIGPLLAGAGIVGLAVGFGAQKLVQDVITGIFILMEDSINVGDVVTVGGMSGLVERLSIRSIRLRDLSGDVHTIPFSTVNTVTNMTKEFAYALFDVGVAYRENTDEVTGVLKDIAAEMKADPEYGPLILEPLEVLGVDEFADSAVVIKVRLKTQPIKQWQVKREFNRRMKKRFDELGIEIPFPHTTLYFGEDKKGAAPAARIKVDTGTPEPGPSAPGTAGQGQGRQPRKPPGGEESN